jgi:lipoprotein-anchoring transpeptidase ErfK/SrfK
MSTIGDPEQAVGRAPRQGARALYLGYSLYRIHGTNEPDTIGENVSSGCIRMMNEDVTDLYGRVDIGTRVVVVM